MKPTLFVQESRFRDQRGYFYEAYKQSHLLDGYGFKEKFIQDNISVSKKNVIRGMHYQWDLPMGKLVRVIKGEIMDVAVDIRKNSAAFGKKFYYTLSEENGSSLYIPPGFAHGFVSKKNESVVLYKCTSEYNRNGESGINPFDSTLNIEWGISIDQAILSEKDKISKSFKEYKNNPAF